MEPVSNVREINLNRRTPTVDLSSNSSRIMNELRKYSEDVHYSDGIVLEFADDLRTVTGYIQILDEDSPYYGGCFVVEALIPEGYPYKTPEIRFLTRIWHPKVDLQSGNFSIGTSWSPGFTVQLLFQALQIAISNPEAEDPLELAIGKQMRESPYDFKKTAKFWTKKYACETKSSDDKEVEETGDD